MRRSSLHRRLAVLFLVTGAVAAILAALVTVSLLRLDAATGDRVDRFGPALLEAETLSRAYSDQEVGLRGFLAGGRADFLEPYRNGRATERATVGALRGHLAGRPDLLRRLRAVQREASAWRSEVAEPLIARVREDGPALPTPAEVHAGTERFDRVRSALADLREPIRAARDAAGAQLEVHQERVRDVFILGLAGLVTLLVATGLALQRWVVEPLRALGREVDRVADGDLSRQLAVTTAPREIADLNDQVERMRVRILHEYALAEASRAEALRAQAVVEEQAEDLRRSNAELEQFAYVASHDLQEPLRKVASFCQLIERRYQGQLDERGEQYIAFAVDGAKRMQQLINDLLAFSRVGRRSGEFEPVALEDVLGQALRQLSALLDDTGAVVTHDALPVVRGDASLLVQLLQNLVGNGVKFRSEQAPRIHVGVGPQSDGQVELFCQDNGIGIDEQYEEKIFVIFQRLHGRDSYEGTGIGLAMCRKIVEFHGGRLWLDNEATSSAGSLFRFTLPLAADNPRAGEPDQNGRDTR